MTTRQLLDGLGVMLAANGIGAWSDSYTDDQVGIVIGPRVPQSPSALIVLTPYNPRPDDHQFDDTTQRVQIRYRGLTGLDVLERDDRVFDLLQDLAGADVGGVIVVDCGRVNRTPNGVDDNDRVELFANYDFEIAAPTRYRTE